MLIIFRVDGVRKFDNLMSSLVVLSPDDVGCVGDGVIGGASFLITGRVHASNKAVFLELGEGRGFFMRRSFSNDFDWIVSQLSPLRFTIAEASVVGFAMRVIVVIFFVGT